MPVADHFNRVPLLERHVAGIHVVLLYARQSDEVFVFYRDDAGEEFVMPVRKDCALDAYHHPVIYWDSLMCVERVHVSEPAVGALSA